LAPAIKIAAEGRLRRHDCPKGARSSGTPNDFNFVPAQADTWQKALQPRF
jgi:hypothetical protein